MTENGSANICEKIYKTPYGSIHYWISPACAGSPWLIFLPGLTADHHLFDKQLEGLGKSFGCFVWDAPAHGLSRPFELQFSMDDMARWLHDILQTERICRPILIGQSMGGYISQAYMELFPGSAAGFVSIDSCPLKKAYYSGWELAWLKHTKGMYRSIPWRLLVKWGAAGTAASEYGRMLMRRTIKAYEKAEYCALAGHGFRILAEAVEADREYGRNCPTLLLCGEKDMAGAARRYNVKWAKREGLALIWLAGAGHNSNTDAPERVNRIIEEFAAPLGTVRGETQ